MRDVQLGWVCAMLDVLREWDISRELKKHIEKKEKFQEAYDFELEHIKDLSQRNILGAAMSLLEELGDYHNEGTILEKVDFHGMYEQLAKKFYE